MSEAALLAAVRASPADDLPRLVFADFLDENDQPERAEFVRLQCELDRVCTACKGRGRYDDDMGGTMQCRGCHGKKTMRGWESRQMMRGRERELLREHAAAWLLPSPTPFPPVVIDPEQTGWGLAPNTRLGDRYLPVEFRRGFVAEVWCTMADWCGGECEACGGQGVPAVVTGHWQRCSRDSRCTGRTPGIGLAVVGSHPVEVVRLVGREPLPQNGYWHWGRVGGSDLTHAHWIHNGVWDVMYSQVHGRPLSQGQRYLAFDTEANAHKALSVAALAWAKLPASQRAPS